MSQEGQRIEFDDAGPYLIQFPDGPGQAMLLEEHPVCLFQFGEIYLPVGLSVAPALAAGLSNMRRAAMGPEREGMTPIGFEEGEPTELPLLTGTADEAFQHGETVFIDVRFGDTAARLCFSIPAAALVGQVLSQIPAA
ncbi:hypothetical protein [Pseudodesulfovibrio sp.]|uniref:hypothetical protein n=1 Tax=Pseudodesulfovibrio sp. TaxID=2035812 RepID=UPI00260BC507|nr:hypothetical protein [Pseudodesulfovibrio sp.]MDD3313060.1 hypothetical protein [Pseudodesulfovibrio sp.]